jgi:hypothetical protein
LRERGHFTIFHEQPPGSAVVQQEDEKSNITLKADTHAPVISKNI